MTIIQDKPDNLPTSNALDNLPDDLLGGPPPPADIILAGKTLTTLAEPPSPGETRVLMIRVRAYEEGITYGDNGEGEATHFRKTKLISCWLPGQPEPVSKKTQAEKDAEAEAEAAKNQPPLYDESGGPSAEAAGDE